MLQLPQLVYLWQVPDAIGMTVQHTQFAQLTQNLQHRHTFLLPAKMQIKIVSIL